MEDVQPRMPPPSEELPLAGTLLLAVPSLRDPSFRRAVVFIAAHDAEEGAFGYVLNRPLHQRVAELLPGENLGPLGEVPVYAGGPVAADKLAFASLRWIGRTLRCQTHLTVEDALHELGLGREVRGFVGYSGWSGGQIESEIERRSWIITPPSRAVLAPRAPENLWSEVLCELGPVFGLMARTPERVELN
jgi:putative transcriptional regulator